MHKTFQICYAVYLWKGLCVVASLRLHPDPAKWTCWWLEFKLTWVSAPSSSFHCMLLNWNMLLFVLILEFLPPLLICVWHLHGPQNSAMYGTVCSGKDHTPFFFNLYSTHAFSVTALTSIWFILFVFFLILLFFKLRYSWYKMLCWLLLYNSDSVMHIYTFVFSSVFQWADTCMVYFSIFLTVKSSTLCR